MSAAAAIDLDKLRASAFGGSTPMAIVDRKWLQSVFRALTGTPFVDVSAPAAPGPIEREILVMQPIGAVTFPGA